MSLKAELDTWVEALNAYDSQDFDKALDLFSRIADSSKILTNIGLIHATLGEHELAVQNFNGATQLDQFLAVAYFQCGVSNFLLGRYDLAYKDFEDAYLYLRGNESIKYQQLGLQFTLYSAEVLFNRGLAQMYLNRMEEGLADMRAAQKEKATAEHDVIDECIRDQGEGYTVFSIPVGVLYRPPESKVKNSKAKDYLGKAKLVAATDSQNMFTGFTGSELLSRGQAPSGAKIDNRPPKDEPELPRPALPKPSATPLARAPTQIRPAQASESARAGGRGDAGSPPPSTSAPSGGAGLQRGASIAQLGPTRGLSVRRTDSPGPGASAGPPPPRKEPPATRLTEIYDDYIGFQDEPAPMPPPVDNSRVANWASRVQPSAPPSSFPGSLPSSRAGSIRNSPSMRRKPSTARSRAPSRRMTSSVAYDDEEGYGSGGDYDEGAYYELVKILVKIHYRDDTRGMAVSPDMPYDEFLERVTSKFGRSLGGLSLRFKDEDGARISLKDEMDYELAVETARESAKGKPEGKLEIWCEDA